jgi:hypothetical protein
MAKVKIVKNERDPPLCTGKLLIKFQNILHVDNQLQASCEPLMAKGEELVKCRLIQGNIATAVESLNLCLPGKSTIIMW